MAQYFVEGGRDPAAMRNARTAFMVEAAGQFREADAIFDKSFVNQAKAAAAEPMTTGTEEHLSL
jgi:hypothetical protein